MLRVWSEVNYMSSEKEMRQSYCDKRDDFDFDMIHFHYLDGDVLRRISYGVYISQLIRFARVSSNVNDFN